ncbi:Hypp9663, partial [Branchiostoma lanceolatum]
RLPGEFSDTVIRLGGFHVALNYLSLLGKQYKGSGLDDLLLESGVYGSSTTRILLEGKSYNRGVRAHKLTMEVMLRLQWQAYMRSIVPGGGDIPPEVEEEVSAFQLAYEKASDLSDPMKSLQMAMPALMRKFEHFKSSMKAKSYLFAFWDEYVSMVLLLLQFIKAERSGDWPLHLSATARMVPCYNSMDRTNYARWLPVYLADMRQLQEKHPQVHHAFMTGEHAIARSNQPFAKVWTDMALEQSINLDSKTSGGVVGISQKPGALERWFLTVHERAAMATALKQMLGMADSDLVATHKDAREGRLKRDEEDVQKMTNMFEGLMTNPFHVEDSEGDIHPLINFATGVVMPEDTTVRLINAYEIGLEQCRTFVRQRLDSNEVGFWDPLPHLNIKTFASISQTRRMTTNDKIVTISADRDLFGRLVIAARSRHIDLKGLLSHELCAVPLSMVHTDGTMRKTCKSALLSELEKEVQVHARLPVACQMPTSYIIDGMAMIQAVGAGGTAFFGDLAILHYRLLTSNFVQYCHRVDVVFDQYNKMSIKDGERLRRVRQSSFEVKIQGPTTPIPKQWKKYVANPKNKANLSAYLTQTFCELGMNQLLPGQKMILGGGCEDGERAVLVTNNHMEDLKSLYSDHEEADTRMLLHVQHAARECRRVVVNSPDTDVAVICTSFCSELQCEELWFRTGVKDKARFIPIHNLSRSLGQPLCRALPAFHAITGCDSTASFAGIGKKKAWSILCQNPEHQSNLANFGHDPEMEEECFRNSENFVCDLYQTGKAPCSVDDMRYFIFCQKRQRNEVLPPTSDSLRQHLQRSTFQTCLWRRALKAMQNMPQPDGRGWEERGTVLAPVLMTKDPAPKSLVELVACGCTTSCRRANCSCRVHSLACTEACKCMGNDDCQNPNKLMETTSSFQDINME